MRQYDPPLEELRMRHYREHLSAFLGLPLRMKGVSDLSERPGFFRPIVDAAPDGKHMLSFLGSCRCVLQMIVSYELPMALFKLS